MSTVKGGTLVCILLMLVFKLHLCLIFASSEDSGVSHVPPCENGFPLLRDDHALQKPGHRLGTQSPQVGLTMTLT